MKKMNPAAKNMIQLLFYIVLMIGMWAIIGMVAFPKTTTAERLTEYVEKNEKVLVQVAENAMDENVNPGIMNSVEVLKILGEEHIAKVEPYQQGAVFHIHSDSDKDNGVLDIIYLPDGQYAFTREGNWTAASPDAKGTLRWVSENTWVAATKMTDHFFLEESNTAQ
jgi:hypothetical protein